MAAHPCTLGSLSTCSLGRKSPWDAQRDLGSRMSIPGAMSHLVPFPATPGSQPRAHPTPCLFPLPIFARRHQHAVTELKASKQCDVPNPREALEHCLHLGCWGGGSCPCCQPGFVLSLSFLAWRGGWTALFPLGIPESHLATSSSLLGGNCRSRGRG